MTNKREKITRIVQRMYLLICDMAEISEDYSLLQRNYNELIEEYDLPFKKIHWISVDKFEER